MLSWQQVHTGCFCLVLIACMYELRENWSLFLVINKSIEYMYCDWSGRIFKLLNSSLQGAFLFEFMIILINLFWILNISLLSVEFPQNMSPYDIIKCAYEKYVLLSTFSDTKRLD